MSNQMKITTDHIGSKFKIVAYTNAPMDKTPRVGEIGTLHSINGTAYFLFFYNNVRDRIPFQEQELEFLQPPKAVAKESDTNHLVQIESTRFTITGREEFWITARMDSSNGILYLHRDLVWRTFTYSSTMGYSGIYSSHDEASKVWVAWSKQLVAGAPAPEPKKPSDNIHVTSGKGTFYIADRNNNTYLHHDGIWRNIAVTYETNRGGYPRMLMTGYWEKRDQAEAALESYRRRL